MIKIKILPVNDFGVNSFILSDESKECIFIDPGFYYPNEIEDLHQYVRSNQFEPKFIINTHGHIDHLLGAQNLKENYSIPFFTSEEEKPLVDNAIEFGRMFGFELKKTPTIDRFINHNDLIRFGNSVLKVIFVPGHSPGSLAFYSSEGNFIIAGDVLFNGSIGRTDLPGGDYETLLYSIKSKLLILPAETTVYPGHGPITTIGYEASKNPFLI